MAVEFGVLGEVVARVDGVGIDLGHARQRCVLAVLLVEADRMVTTDQLVDRVWGEPAPLRARHALYSYLSRLRTVLGAVPGVAIARVSGGYMLRVDAECVDLHRFRALVARDVDDGRQALDVVERALRLWRDEPFKGAGSWWLASVAERLLEERFTAEVRRNEVALRLGLHARLPAELAAATGARPFDERLAAQYVLTLYRCGRQADALAHYRAFRDRLVDEVGVEPGEELRRLHRRILTADVVPAVPPAVRAGEPVPRQLPAASPWFVARARELDRLDEALDGAAGLVVITGAGGAGKTSLALHWAHKRAKRFPDGQLYVNLRGVDRTGRPLPSDEALRGFVEALGVAPERVPADLDARAALYRSLLAGRRALVVLDNAHDAEQVRPLLPGDANCLAVVTSRHGLACLVAQEGAVPVTLDALAEPEAVALLTRRLGRDRVSAEPAAVAELVEHAARLPLALAVVAGRAVSDPSFPLAALAGQLRDEHSRLPDLDAGEPVSSVRAVSYRASNPAAARLFRLLGLHPGPGTDLYAAAAAGLDVPIARELLTELIHSHHLLDERTAGRYRSHDLLRSYAAVRSALEDLGPQRSFRS